MRKTLPLIKQNEKLSKPQLWCIGIGIIKDFCALNNVDFPNINAVPHHDLDTYGYYTKKWGIPSDKGKIVVNLGKAKYPVINPTDRLQSFPGNKTDRTVLGVMMHEFGHYIDFTFDGGTFGKNDTLFQRKFFRLDKKEKTISSYDTIPSERMAESFRLFMLNPHLLQVGRPLTYEILSAHFKPLFVDYQWQDVFSAIDKKDIYIRYCKGWINKK